MSGERGAGFFFSLGASLMSVLRALVATSESAGVTSIVCALGECTAEPLLVGLADLRGDESGVLVFGNVLLRAGSARERDGLVAGITGKGVCETLAGIGAAILMTAGGGGNGWPEGCTPAVSLLLSLSLVFSLLVMSFSPPFDGGEFSLEPLAGLPRFAALGAPCVGVVVPCFAAARFLELVGDFERVGEEDEGEGT